MYADAALQWRSSESDAWGAYSDLPLSTLTSTAGEYTFYVRQTYTSKTNTNSEVCVGDSETVTVTVNETTEPTGSFSVSYVLADAEENGGSFKDLVSQDSKSVDIESGYTYEFAKCDEKGVVSGTWSSSVTPAVPTDLAGGTKTEYYLVRRTKDGCVSPTKMITVTISDAPQPVIEDLYYCEGETMKSFDEAVTVNTQRPGTYTLLWYGTTMPTTQENMANNGTTVPTGTSIAEYTAANNGKTVYYVSQKDENSGAISSPKAFTVTVYPTPVQTIATLDAVCGKQVDLSSALKVNNVTGTTAKFFSDAAGTMSVESSVTESGTYYVQSSYAPADLTNSTSVCASTVDPIDVTIDVLTIDPIADGQTCPDMEAEISATVKANTASVVYNWTGGKMNDDITDEQTVSGGTAESKFTSSAQKGTVAGDIMTFNLTVTAGSCVKTAPAIKVTIGDGPIVGTLTLAEENNAQTGKAYNNSRYNNDDPFYTCGNEITASHNLTKTEGDYTWTKDGTAIGTGDNVTLTGAGKYVISYTNKCATTVEFEVIDASIKNNKLTVTTSVLDDSNEEKDSMKICELSDYAMSLSYVCNEANTVVWTKDGVATTRAAGKEMSVSSAKPSDSGAYAYTITSHGCTVADTMNLQVKPYIKFAPEQTQYVAKADSQLLIKTIITVPAAGEPSNIEWTEGGTTVNATADYTAKVDKDHAYTITMTDPNYCDASATVTVIKDALLKLKVKMTDEQMCRGDEGIYLIIDTAGTGNIIYPAKAKINVVEKTEYTNKSLTGWTKIQDTLKLAVSPNYDATYEVTFKYREGEANDAQLVTATASIEVLQPLQIQVPNDLSVCSGDEINGAITITPTENVTVKWDEDPTLTSSDGTSFTGEPTYDEATANVSQHYSTYTYKFTAVYPGCKDKNGSVKVKVIEPIDGELVTDTTVCEGTRLRLDASNFGAKTYTWTTEAVANEISSSSIASFIPDESAVYNLHMTRGTCTKDVDVNVTVISNPVISSIDSISYRSININVDAAYGKAPYQYRVDDGVPDASSQKDSLTYSVHTAYVVDAFGCTTNEEFTIKAPRIEIPPYFTPNGDGVKETWTVPSISETYPDAEFTIYDRYGKKVASFKGSDNGWDGTYNGEPMPTTDYWYTIHLREIDKVYTGHFTLLRR